MASLMELHGADSFKVKGYQNALFHLERHSEPLSGMSMEELGKIQGIGKGIATSIDEINRLGQAEQLKGLLANTPDGLMELLDIKGLGIKKVRSIWQELGAEDLDSFLEAAAQGRLAKLKGFGEKTQANIRDILHFTKSNRGRLHYATAEDIAHSLMGSLKDRFPNASVSITGDLRRKMETIDTLELVIGSDDRNEARKYLGQLASVTYSESASGPFSFRGQWAATGTPIWVHLCPKQDFPKTLLMTTGSPKHISSLQEEGISLKKLLKKQDIKTEEEAYTLMGMPYIVPELREDLFEFEQAKTGEMPDLIEMADLKGILHNHSTYSDGKHSLEEMALHCRDLGYEYLGITDHSQSAFYANGLTVDRVKAQHQEIDALNERLAPFKIFKGIESDILSDGSLDYENDTLASFDFIVSSIHSGLGMDLPKATERLLKAISDPHTTLLGHATGRLLLKREGYPIDHQRIIEACAEHGVIIEINANPWRLDLDWRWVHYAMEKGVMLSINPDAHEKEGYAHMYYGLCVGRKGGLTKAMNFNSLSRTEVEAHFKKRKQLLPKP